MSNQSAEARLLSEATKILANSELRDCEKIRQQFYDRVNRALAATPAKPSASDEEIARNEAHKRGYTAKNDPERLGFIDGYLAASATTRTAPSRPEVGNHECEYATESEDARCPHCGLTSGEAVKYLERNGAAAPSEDTKRLDWILSNRTLFQGDGRAAVDAAMNAAHPLPNEHPLP